MTDRFEPGDVVFVRPVNMYGVVRPYDKYLPKIPGHTCPVVQILGSTHADRFREDGLTRAIATFVGPVRLGDGG